MTRKKAKATIQARYDAAGTGRRMRGWSPPSSGPNTAITGLQNIRNRARDAARNDWSGESGLQKWTTNLVGVGIIPRLKSTYFSAERKKQLQQLWDDWVKVADADEVLNFYALQALAVRTWLDGGECFIRFRDRLVTAPLVVPLQIQLLEAEYVPMLDADQWPGMPAGNRIRSGIELNKYNRRIAYWMHRDHPGDRDAKIDPAMLIRVPAEQVSHMFMPTRPGQLRGVSQAAAVLARLRNIENYDDAVLTRQMIANLFALFITRPVTGGEGDGVDPMTGLPYDLDATGKAVAALQPGVSHELAPGEDVRFANPPEAGTTYSDYMRTAHLGTAAGFGLPYEVFSGDIKDVSDRTLRVIINEFRRFASQRQWHCIIPMMCERTRDRWVDAAALAGAVRLTEVDGARRVEWSPEGWEYIHPVQDAQGKQIEVDAGFRSRSSVIAERGDDPELVDQERKEDLERDKANGLHVDPVEAAAKGDQKRDEQMQAFHARFDALAAQKPEPTSVVVNNHVPPTQVTAMVEAPTVHVAAPNVQVDNNVPAPVVNVQNDVAAPNVQVDVAAPNVSVTNKVQPAEVKVELPDRQTTSVVERDANGNITNVTQTETTLQ